MKSAYWQASIFHLFPHLCNNCPTPDANQYPISLIVWRPHRHSIGSHFDKKGVSQGRFGFGKEFHKCNLRVSCLTSGFYRGGRETGRGG